MPYVKHEAENHKSTKVKEPKSEWETTEAMQAVLMTLHCTAEHTMATAALGDIVAILNNATCAIH